MGRRGEDGPGRAPASEIPQQCEDAGRRPAGSMPAPSPLAGLRTAEHLPQARDPAREAADMQDAAVRIERFGEDARVLVD